MGELDVYDYKYLRDDVEGDWFVYHIPVIDTGTTCDMLSDCLKEFKAWSDANPLHEPVTVWIDLKTELRDTDLMDQRLALSGLDFFTPNDLLGEHRSLREAVSHGWPTESDLRGKFIV